MSMQINVDPAGLTQEQREAVAGFILAYPGKACAGSCGKHTLGLEVRVDTTKAVAAVDALAAHANAAGLPAAVAGAVDVELATLQHDCKLLSADQGSAANIQRLEREIRALRAELEAAEEQLRKLKGDASR